MVKKKGKRVKRRTIQLPINENDKDIEEFLAYQSNIGKSIKTLLLLALTQMGNVDVRDYLLNQQIRGKNLFGSNSDSNVPIQPKIEKHNANNQKKDTPKPKQLKKRNNTLDKNKKISNSSNKVTTTVFNNVKELDKETQQNNFKDIWNDNDSGLL